MSNPNTTIIEKVCRCLVDPDRRFLVLAARGFYKKLDDETYLKRMYQAKMGCLLDLNSPRTFNEKLQWLKLHDRNPLYTTLVDKYAVRQYIADTIGEEYLIPLLGKWDNPDEIDFDKLPNQFVLKCNHDSGGLVICRDKSKLNIAKAKKKLKKSLNRDFYYLAREWPYKNVIPCIIAEKYMENEGCDVLTDYKFMCFNGKVEYIFTCTERNKELKVTFFDIDWNKQEFSRHYPRSEEEIQRPINFELMVKLAEQLSRGIPFVRVDIYEIGGKVYFGEMTFYPGAGFEEFSPAEYDEKLGEMIRLPEEKIRRGAK